MRVRSALAFVFTLGLLVLPESADACAVCYGGADTALTQGMNNGILVLLGVVGLVQGGLLAMFYTFWRRARDLRARRDSFRVLDGGVNR